MQNSVRICCHYLEADILVFVHTESPLVVVALPKERSESGSHSHGSAFRDCNEGDEKRKKRPEEEISDLEEITGPYVFCMIAQECSPVLSSRLRGANVLHIC